MSEQEPVVKTASGFSWDDAEALGVRLVCEAPGDCMAEYRADGAVVAWRDESIGAVLVSIEDWNLTRRRMGVAASAPVAVEAR